MQFPSGLFYTQTHTWLKIEQSWTFIGLTEYIAQQLTDIIAVDIPLTGQEMLAGEAYGSIETQKDLITLLMPASGTIIAANTKLLHMPHLINRSPYTQGWIIRMLLSHPLELSRLLSILDYQHHIRQCGN